MQVELKTRCGCTKLMNLPAPLPPFVLLPLVRTTSWFHAEMEIAECDITRPSTYAVRRFDRYGGTQLYIEREG